MPAAQANSATGMQAMTSTFAGAIVTTSAVLTELGNHLSAPVNRRLFLETVQRLRRGRRARIVHVSRKLFQAGMELFEARADKSWSVTDCVSFVVMEQLKIKHALTTDHHFRQAGFKALFEQS